MPPAAETTSFRAVMGEILRRITTGPWGPGTLLPTEVELAGEFGCSRTTINRALREVSDLGLLDRRRKAGTRVRLAPIRQARFACHWCGQRSSGPGRSIAMRCSSGTGCPHPTGWRRGWKIGRAHV